MHADLLGQSRRLGRGPADGVKHLRIDRLVAPPGKQPVRRTCQAPVGQQDAEQLRRDGSVLGTLPWRTWITMRSLLISAILRLTASEARRPAA